MRTSVDASMRVVAYTVLWFIVSVPTTVAVLVINAHRGVSWPTHAWTVVLLGLGLPACLFSLAEWLIAAVITPTGGVEGRTGQPSQNRDNVDCKTNPRTPVHVDTLEVPKNQ